LLLDFGSNSAVKRTGLRPAAYLAFSLTHFLAYAFIGSLFFPCVP
jgi:hypothetical protein